MKTKKNNKNIIDINIKRIEKSIIKRDHEQNKEALQTVRTIIKEYVPARNIAALIAALDDEFPEARVLARQWLAELSGEDFGNDTAQWRLWWEQNKNNFI